MSTSPVAAMEAPKSKGLNIALWIVQGLLAFAFIGSGLMKATAPIEEMMQNMAWVKITPVPLVRFIGVAEVAGGLGLLLPALTRILPILTPFAGIGLATIMVLALGVHAKLGEFYMFPVNLVLAGLAAFVAWGRLKKVPIRPRS